MNALVGSTAGSASPGVSWPGLRTQSPPGGGGGSTTNHQLCSSSMGNVKWPLPGYLPPGIDTKFGITSVVTRQKYSEPDGRRAPYAKPNSVSIVVSRGAP